MFRFGASGTGAAGGAAGGGGLGFCTLGSVAGIYGWIFPGGGWVGESCTLGAGAGMLWGRTVGAGWGWVFTRFSICDIWM